MDFLDPRRRRTHSIRLMIGYGLMAIAIGLGALILVYGAYGYGITRGGDVIQNGLLFVDSQPGGADIFLNDKAQGSKTAARLILPADTYKLTLKKDGYRTWERTFTLTEHSVARYVYPFLFPLQPQVATLKTYSSNPPFITQSLDRRRLLVQAPDSSGVSIVFDEFDTTNFDQPPKNLALPGSLLTNANRPDSTLKEVEWSSDNKHLLLQHMYSGGQEFIIFNRENPAESININRLFSLAPTEVVLRNKKIDQLYIFNQGTGELQIGNPANLTLRTVLTGVLAFRPSGGDLISYITAQNAPPGQVSARIWDGNKSYLLSSFPVGSKYLIDMAKFQDHWYYVAGSNTHERLNIYKDPLGGIKDPSVGKAIPLLSLNIKDATKISFSANARFIAGESGQKLAVYDIETQTAYHYTLNEPLAESLHWMDGHRLIGASNGAVFVTDYDSTNHHLLVPTNYAGGGFFNPDYNNLLTTASGDSGSVALQSIDLRAGVDLPKP